jgi:hypothetical protein
MIEARIYVNFHQAWRGPEWRRRAMERTTRELGETGDLRRDSR